MRQQPSLYIRNDIENQQLRTHQEKCTVVGFRDYKNTLYVLLVSIRKSHRYSGVICIGTLQDKRGPLRYNGDNLT